MTRRRLDLPTRLVLAMVVLNAIWIALTPLTLFPDEAYYWDWSRHLAPCYVSKGPGVALLLALSTRLFGQTEFAIRLPAVLLYGLTVWLTSRLVTRYGSPRAALWATLVLLLAPMLHGGWLFMTTDSPVALCWVAALGTAAAALEAAERGQSPDLPLLGCGIAIGAGLLAKPTMLLLPLIICRVAWGRGLLGSWRRPAGYFALALGAAPLVVLTVWNAAHGWPLVEHLAWLTWQDGWSFALPEFVLWQAVLVTPWLLWFCLRTNLAAWRRPESAAEQLFATSFLAVMLAFTLKSCEGKVEPNWPAMAYWGGVLAASLRWSTDRQQQRWWLRWQPHALLWAAGVILVIRVVPLLHYAVDSDLLYAIDTTHRAAGFDRLGERIGVQRARLAVQLGVPPEAVPLVAVRYQAAAETAFYTPGHPEVSCLEIPERRENAYDLWQSELPVGATALFVLRREHESPPASVSAQFDSWQRLEVVPLQAGRRIMDRYTLFAVRGYHRRADVGTRHE